MSEPIVWNFPFLTDIGRSLLLRAWFEFLFEVLEQVRACAWDFCLFWSNALSVESVLLSFACLDKYQLLYAHGCCGLPLRGAVECIKHLCWCLVTPARWNTILSPKHEASELIPSMLRLWMESLAFESTSVLPKTRRWCLECPP